VRKGLNVVEVERRAFPRHEVNLAAHLALRIGDESNIVIRIPATVCSISRNGARLDIPKWAGGYFEPGKPALLRIDHPRLRGRDLRCRVVWLKDSQLAVKFAGRPRFAQFDASALSWTVPRPQEAEAPRAGIEHVSI